MNMQDHIIPETLVHNDDFIRSQPDQRKYKFFALKNGLKILLISDKTSDHSAASLDVNVGSLYDPKNLPGLAHFCEHMLFRGSEEFPEEDGFENFISENSGTENASTTLSKSIHL